MNSVYKERSHMAGGERIRQVAMGMNDGVVSIFALLAGIAGAGQSSKVILITLMAATIAGAISMATGEFISEKNENDFYLHEINRERLELQLVPEIEKDEIRLIYQAKGVHGTELDEVTNQITSNPERWLKELCQEEIGVSEVDSKGMMKNILIIFAAFCLGASFSLVPYLFYNVVANRSHSLLFCYRNYLSWIVRCGRTKTLCDGTNVVKIWYRNADHWGIYLFDHLRHRHSRWCCSIIFFRYFTKKRF